MFTTRFSTQSRRFLSIFETTPVRNLISRIKLYLANQLTSENAFGNTQLDMDVQVDSMIYDFLKESPYVAMAISEERPYPTFMHKKTGEYNVCFDPIDGSNILESNYAVGSIFGIMPSG